MMIFAGNYWEHPKNLRNFFERFATSNSFDPLVSDNWYSVPRRLLLEYPVCKEEREEWRGLEG